MADLAIQLAPQSLGSPQFSDLALTATGDLQVASGIQAISQAVHLRLTSFVSDFFLAMDEGLDYYGELLRNPLGYTARFEAAMQNTVLSTPGVTRLMTWSAVVDRSSRALSVNFEAECLGGTVNFSVPIGTIQA